MREIPPETFRAIETLKWNVLCCILLYNYCHVIRCTFHWILNSFFTILQGVTIEKSRTFGSTKRRFPPLLVSPWNRKLPNPPNTYKSEHLHALENCELQLPLFCSPNFRTYFGKIFQQVKKYIITKLQLFNYKNLRKLLRNFWPNRITTNEMWKRKKKTRIWITEKKHIIILQNKTCECLKSHVNKHT